MAIEVIGKDPAHYRETTCRNCASILRFVLADVQKKQVSDYTGDTDTVYYVPCPCCSNQVST